MKAFLPIYATGVRNPPQKGLIDLRLLQQSKILETIASLSTTMHIGTVEHPPNQEHPLLQKVVQEQILWICRRAAARGHRRCHADARAILMAYRRLSLHLFLLSPRYAEKARQPLCFWILVLVGLLTGNRCLLTGNRCLEAGKDVPTLRFPPPLRRPLILFH